MAATLQRGHIIEDEGVALTQRSVLNFTGPGVSASDSGGETVVDIQGGSPSGAAGGVLAGTYPAPTFAQDMVTQVELGDLRLDELEGPTSDVSLNNQKIIGLEAPTVPTDAANKAYVDAVASGFDVKLSVRAATTANITLSGAQTIDGVSVIAGDRVLVKNQTDAGDNGIYVAAAGAWARSTDADTDAEVTSGMFTFIEEGTANGDQGWALITDDPIVVGTTDLVFTQVAGVGGGGSPTGAAGGVLSGTYPNPGFAEDMATQAEVDAAVAAHVNDATGAHAATAIAFTPDGSISATNVQAAIIEVRDEAGGGGGGAVDDQTIVTTDNTVNNVSTAKHGWTPKAPNDRSKYLDGTGNYRLLHGTKEWYVDSTVAAGGNGRSPGGAFTTFAAANAAATPRETIYILSDLTENCVLTKEDVRVQGVGQRVLYANGVNTITMNVTARECQLDNLYFNGHATFTGISLCFNFNSGAWKASNIYINGTGGAAFPTFYPSSPSAQSGIGGIGVLCHHAELGNMDGLHMKRCSIGVGLGTWSSGNTFDKVQPEENCQDLVVGLYTGHHSNPAIAPSTFQYGLVGGLAATADDQCGNGSFRDWRPVSNIASPSNLTPAIDLIGDSTTNYAGSSGANNHFENMVVLETGAAGPYKFRIGTCSNTFIKPYISTPCLWLVAGQKNHFVGLSNQYVLAVSGNNNVFDTGYIYPNSGSNIFGGGANNIFRNYTFQAGLVPSGIQNTYEKCVFTGATPITRANFGAGADIRWGQGTIQLAYGTTVVPQAHVDLNLLTVTNGTAFTLSNPVDGTNSTDTSKILVTTPLQISIFNNSGGAMGAITWGSKYKLAGGTGTWTNPATGKWATITFIYDFLNDAWVETNRSVAVG